MRFLLKIGFWLALIAFFLPAPGGGDGSRDGVNTFGAFVGAQQALSDLGGFCERSPAACDAGQDVGRYVASRIGDGLAYGYALVQGGPAAAPHEAAPGPATRTFAAPAPYTPARPAGAASERAAPPEPRRAPAAGTDPMQTAAVAAERVRQASGLPAFAMPAMKERERPEAPRPAGFVHAGNARSIPLPTPRP